ncbi:MAG: alpha/beta fold hydrolase [Betaproteobacteria bacterium]|nr:alpha/beta fold hydrolase [Betaproteobacteria bacterium]
MNRIAIGLLGGLMMAGMMGAAAAEPYPGTRDGQVVLHDFRLVSGEVMPTLTIGYTTLGEARRDSRGRIANAVLLLHGTTGTAKNWFLPGLAKQLYGPGQPLDASRYFLVIPDGIGLGRSSKPSDGLRAKFPHYGYRDMVNANYRLLTEGLHVDHLRAVIGTSMGGMQTWLFAEQYPDFMDGAVAIASSPTPVSGRNMMWRQLMIDSIRNAPDWQGGNYSAPPESFLRTWPLFAVMTDSATHLQTLAPTREQAIAHDRMLSEAAHLLDANDVLYRFEASADYHPEVELGKIRAQFLAINFADDLLNPVELQALPRAMPQVAHGTYQILSPKPSFGHQNLGQGAAWGPVAADFLATLPERP